MKSIVEEVVIRNIKDKEYDHLQAKQWSEQIVDQIKNQLKGLFMPSYKILVQAVIGEIGGQGVRIASKCLWDDSNDNFASFTYQNNSLFCTGIVFGIYYE